jgi:hypothetical protein
METESMNLKDVAEPDAVVSGMAGTGQKTTEDTGMCGELVLYLYDRQERIANRLNKKIGRLEQRVTALEERGRS